MRHRQRHVHKTILEHLRTALDDGDWLGDQVPYGATPVTLIDYEPQQAGVTPAPNTVAVSIGDQGDDEPEEMGGGLLSCDYALFVDIYGENEPIGVAIADDIKAALSGQIITLRDYTSDADGDEVDAKIEFEFVTVERFDVATTTVDKRTWRAVKAIACCYF